VGTQRRRSEAILTTEFGNVHDEHGNLRPGAEIKSVGRAYGKDKDNGVSALLAVTVATAQRAAGKAFSTH
jgi:hypothetical protein